MTAKKPQMFNSNQHMCGLNNVLLIHKTPEDAKAQKETRCGIAGRGKIVVVEFAFGIDGIQVFGTQVKLQRTYACMKEGCHVGTVADGGAVLVKKLSQYR